MVQDAIADSIRRQIEKLAQGNQRQVKQEETYDPLSQAQKVMLLPNGLFEFSDIPNISCVCRHKFIDHLDGTGLCLATKNEICLCQEFRETWNQTTVIKPKPGKLPKTEVQVEDPRLNSYIELISKV